MSDSIEICTSKPPRILIAEDNPANQALLRMQLGALGFGAEIVGNGEEARLKWLSGAYDLILTDLNMPGVDGLELAGIIRGVELAGRGGHVVIIGITACDDPEKLLSCRQAGMDDVLFKPIELRNLGDMLARWLPLAAGIPPIDRQMAPLPDAGCVPEITLDRSVLCGVIGNTDAEKTRELLDLFLDTVRQDLPDCRGDLAKLDFPGLALVMHKLKTSARALGASRFAALAGALEAEANAGRMAEAVSLLAELTDELRNLEFAASRLDFAEDRPPLGTRPDNPGLAAPWDDVAVDEFRQAIENQELEIHFQPKIDMASLCVTGIDSYAYWRRKNAMLPMTAFFSLAERIGLIEELGELLVAKSLIGAVRLAAAGCSLPISMTLCGYADSNMRMARLILATATAIGFDLENLILEIPEVLVTENFPAAFELAAYLNPRAVKFSIHDFSASRLDLRRLGGLRIHSIKIDSGIIQQAAAHPGGRVRLQSHLETAKCLKIISIAQALETQGEFERARDLGFDHAQGQTVAERMPLDGLLAWLSRRRDFQ